MTENDPSKLRRSRVIVACLILIAVTARTLPGLRTIDDSYITYRYARNILAGEGFVYNPGERVMGTTTPLYTLMMVGLALFTGIENAPFPLLALLVNALADALTCVLLWQIGKKLGAELPGLVAGVLWAVAPFSVTFAVGGLETSVYVFLLTATIYFYLNKQRKWTTGMAALSILTRPDAIILIGPVALHRLWSAKSNKEKIQWGEVLTFILPGLAWGIFATLYFGSPIPHSITAKIAAYQLPPADAFIRILQHYAIPFMSNHLFGVPGIMVGIFLFPFLYLIGARFAVSQNPKILPWAVYPWLYLIIFSLPNPLIFRWYLTPPLPAYFLFILIGAERILLLISERLFSTGARGKTAFLAGMLLLPPLITTLSAWEIHPDHGPNRPAPQMAWYKLELLYRQAAESILNEMQPDQVLAAGDVGILGFVTNATILDTVGLNSTESLKYYPFSSDKYVINYAIPATLILEEKPDWIIILEVYARKTFLANDEFYEKYELVEKIPTDIYGSDGMLIFRRKFLKSVPLGG